jgi:hypothetical protein
MSSAGSPDPADRPSRADRVDDSYLHAAMTHEMNAVDLEVAGERIWTP